MLTVNKGEYSVSYSRVCVGIVLYVLCEEVCIQYDTCMYVCMYARCSCGCVCLSPPAQGCAVVLKHRGVRVRQWVGLYGGDCPS